MSNPLPYLVRMLLFLAVVAGIGWLLHKDLLRVFNNTPILNTVILGVLVLGIFFVFRQVWILWPEVKWLRRYMHREDGAPPPPAESINLLAPLATMLGEHDRIRLSPTATRAVLDGIATRLDERRELARYIIGLLIFLGLLGTFWGLLETIGSVADAINGLQVTTGDAQQMFARIKGSIEGPLVGMSTAFGASLFGLSGSLVMGFLELQASQAQGRFHIELEGWLARATSLASAGVTGAPQGIPAYVEALLERNTEGVDGLVRALQRVEDSRLAASTSNAALLERLGALAETTRIQQTLLARFTELSIELRDAIGRLGDRGGAEADRDRILESHRALETQIGTYVTKLADDAQRERARVIEELRGLANRVTGGSGAEAGREALAGMQRAIEDQLARLAHDSSRDRANLAEELRTAIGRLSERSSGADRDALAAYQRTIEAHLARLADDATQNRIALADELRGELRLLARTIALKNGAGAGQPPAGD